MLLWAFTHQRDTDMSSHVQRKKQFAMAAYIFFKYRLLLKAVKIKILCHLRFQTRVQSGQKENPSSASMACLVITTGLQGAVNSGGHWATVVVK